MMHLHSTVGVRRIVHGADDRGGTPAISRGVHLLRTKPSTRNLRLSWTGDMTGHQLGRGARSVTMAAGRGGATNSSDRG